MIFPRSAIFITLIASVASSLYARQPSYCGISANDKLGSHAIAGVGDVDLDGVADYAVHGDDRVDLISGSNGMLLHSWSGSTSNTSSYGRALAGAGDLNGDGVPDLIIGDRQTKLLAGHPGYAEARCSITGALIFAPWIGNSFDDEFGGSVSNLGDLDLDGFPEIGVGSTKVDVNGGTGYSKVFRGYDGSTLAILQGQRIGNVGDLDGDGFPEVATGTPDYAAGGQQAGGVWVFDGGTIGSGSPVVVANIIGIPFASLGRGVTGVGDFNGDSVVDLAVRGSHTQVYSGSSLLSPSPTTLLDISGSSQYPSLGYAVTGPGDVDGDGYSDLLVSDPSPTGNHNQGCVIAISGKNHEFLSVTVGQAPDDRFGQALGNIGDTDGDGLPDFLTTAPLHDCAGLTDNGAAYVVKGCSGPNCGTFLNSYGSGCPGTGGLVPTLVASGIAAPGGQVTLSMNHAVGGTAAILVIGSSKANTSVLPGCSLLVGNILLVTPPYPTSPLFGSGPGAGSFNIGLTMPPTPGVACYSSGYQVHP